MTEQRNRSAFITLGAALRRGLPAPARGEKPTILVATDFSSVAEAAVDVAVALAAKLDARVHLLHLLSIAPIAHADFVWVPTVYEVEKWNLKAQAALRATTERARASQPGVAIDSELITGIQPDDLVAAIEQRQPDVVVVGTHGRGFWSSLVIGSVARAVTRRSNVPVLTVRPESLDPKATTVLVPIELGHVVDDALDFAVGLAAASGAKLRLLYVFPGADEIDIGSGTDMEAAIAVKAQAALELLAGPERSQDMQVESVTRFGRPARQIADEAKACNAAFVVMGTHARSFVERTVTGSVAEDVLQIVGRAVVTCRVPSET